MTTEQINQIAIFTNAAVRLSSENIDVLSDVIIEDDENDSNNNDTEIEETINEIKMAIKEAEKIAKKQQKRRIDILKESLDEMIESEDIKEQRAGRFLAWAISNKRVSQ